MSPMSLRLQNTEHSSQELKLLWTRSMNKLSFLSTEKRWEITNWSIASVPTVKPDKCSLPLLWWHSTKWLHNNNKEDWIKETSCLNPQVLPKKKPRLPFTKIECHTVDIKNEIHFLHFSPKPQYYNIYRRMDSIILILIDPASL